MNITEFASARNEQSQTISIFIKRHPEQFEGHTRKVGKTVELDEVALEILEKQYPLPRPVQLLNGVDPEEHKAVVDKLSSAQEYIIKLHETVEQLKDKVNENEKLIAQAEAQKILLEDKNSQLEAAREEGEKKDTEIDEQKKKIEEQNRQLEELKNENERLKNRSLFERIFNK